MKMNKLLLYTALLLSIFVFQSCLKDQKDAFDESASARIEKYLDNAQKSLISSEYGWILDYYPHEDRQFGGYTYTVKFTKNEVEGQLEVEPKTKAKSLYALKINNGPELSFDTYNNVLHHYSVPTIQQPKGMSGDFEFVIDSIGKDVIKLHGKIYQNVMYLRKLKEDATTYLIKVSTMAENFNLIASAGTIGGKKALVKYDTDNRQATFVDANGKEISTAYNYTDKGIRLYLPVYVNGVELSELSYNDANLSVTGNQISLLKGYVNPILVQKAIGNISTSYDALCKTYKNIPHLDKLEVKSNVNWVKFTKNGNDLTLLVDKNETGKLRKSIITISSGIFKQTITIYQVAVSDILGDYKFVFANTKDEAQMAKANLKINKKGTLLFSITTEDSTCFMMPAIFDRKNLAIKIPTGVTGRYKSKKGDGNLLIVAQLSSVSSGMPFGNNMFIVGTFKFNSEGRLIAQFECQKDGTVNKGAAWGLLTMLKNKKIVPLKILLTPKMGKL